MKYIFSIILALGLVGCHFDTPGEGQKKGQIVKLEKVGFICKTWEGELIRGGFSDGGGTIGGAFHFTLEDKSLLPLALECLEKQTEVMITYETEFMTAPWRSETGTKFITGIKK
jgi:hypothetical protein